MIIDLSNHNLEYHIIMIAYSGSGADIARSA
jgi:hypothetical protein